MSLGKNRRQILVYLSLSNIKNKALAWSISNSYRGIESNCYVIYTNMPLVVTGGTRCNKIVVLLWMLNFLFPVLLFAIVAFDAHLSHPPRLVDGAQESLCACVIWNPLAVIAFHFPSLTEAWDDKKQTVFRNFSPVSPAVRCVDFHLNQMTFT